MNLIGSPQIHTCRNVGTAFACSLPRALSFYSHSQIRQTTTVTGPEILSKCRANSDVVGRIPKLVLRERKCLWKNQRQWNIGENNGSDNVQQFHSGWSTHDNQRLHRQVVSFVFRECQRGIGSPKSKAVGDGYVNELFL